MNRALNVKSRERIVGMPSNLTAGLIPAMRSWWWSAAGIWLFAATIWAGFAVTIVGQSHPALLSIDLIPETSRDPALAGVCEGINSIFGPVGACVLMIVICFCLLGWHRPVQSLAFATTTLAGWLASTIATVIVRRPRPPAAMMTDSTAETAIGSFPSLQTSYAAALIMAVVLVLAQTRTQQITALGFGLIIIGFAGFAAVYVGRSYLSDVIASLLVVLAAAMSWLPVWNGALRPRLSRVST